MRPTLLPLLCSLSLSAAAAEPPASWTEDFSDEAAFDQHWGAYGWLPDGTTSSKKEHRKLWWDITDGALRARTTPGVHPSGLTRQVRATDVRITLRFKLPPLGLIGIGLNGPNRLLGRNFHLCGIHLTEKGIKAYDEDNLHPPDSLETAKLKAEGKWNRKFIIGKTAEIPIAPETWHHLTFQMKGRELLITLNGQEALRYTTLAGDAPKINFQLSAHSYRKEPMFGWFDDITLTSLDGATP